jgi:RNA polymerase sigma-70 factor (ECF subfamily)
MTVQEYNNCVRDYSDKIFRFILKHIGHVEKAEDIVQDVFVKVWIKVDDIAFEKAKSYLFQAAYNTMIDTIRKDKRIELQDEVKMTSSENQPDLGLKEALELALNKLPSIQKSAVLLRDYEGYDYKEIGEILNLNESQVKVYIFRARKNLRAFFTGKEELVA